MQVAGHLVQLATGREWNALVAERLVRPLGLAATTFGSGDNNPRIGGGAVSTARDYARFLAMQLGDGRWRDVRVLSPAAVRALEADQTRGAPIVDSPHRDGRRYGIGVWRDRVAPDGAALQVSSQGAFGFSPWLDRERGIAGVLAVTTVLGNVYGFVDRLQAAVREAVR